MFLSKNPKEFKWYWFDKKMHTVTITSNGELMDIEELYKTATKLTEDKEDLCKTIGYLGLALTSSSEAGWGFLLGWLIRSIKKDQDWQIQHTEEDVSDEELRTQFADILDEMVKKLREGDNILHTTPALGGSDGTDFFKQ
jgi:hypothetical protein